MLRIHLFGNARLFLTDAAQRFSALPRRLPLWFYLLRHRATPIPREQRAYCLWPDEPESSARGTLRRHPPDLRRALPVRIL